MFNVYERSSTDRNSVTSKLVAFDRAKAIEDKKRKSNSIHGSGYWECPDKIIRSVLGIEMTDWRYSFSNRRAAKDGDRIHEDIQTEMVESGQIVQIPFFVGDKSIPREERKKLTQVGRDTGNLTYAVEISIDAWSMPLTQEQKEWYSYQGFADIDPAVSALLEELMMGIRLDTVRQDPDFGFEIPCEIKTIDTKYWTLTEKELAKMTTEQVKKYHERQEIFSDKLMKYIYQLQFQMHFYRDSKTGKRPKVGEILLVNRANTDIRREFTVEYSEEFVNAWIPDIKLTAEAIRKGELRGGRPDKNECPWCEWWSLCDAPGKFKKAADWKAIKAAKAAREENDSAYFESLMAS